jgi:hypothetical protein
MKRVAYLALAASIAACGGTTALGGDASVADGNASGSDDVRSDDGASPADDGGPDAPWWTQFDAAPFDGYELPRQGEVPPNGNAPCQVAPCPSHGLCDDNTGWCCIGEIKNKTCECGLGLGCVPGQYCCGLPDAQVPQCIEKFKCPTYVWDN